MRFPIFTSFAFLGSLAFALPSALPEPESDAVSLVKRINGCSDCTVSGWDLKCKCKTRNTANSAVTRMDLNKCLGNRDGILTWDDNGAVSQSCLPPSISGMIITSNCRNNAGKLISTTKNLDEEMGNDNGYLKCFAHTGCCVSGTCSGGIGCN